MAKRTSGKPVSVVELKTAILEMIAERFEGRVLTIDTARMALAAFDLIQAHLNEVSVGKT
jgi:hypothetical protein